MKKLESCLWFDDQAEEAAAFYISAFKNSRRGSIARYGEAMSGPSGKKAGSVMTVQIHIENQTIVALNGGPLFKLTPALSYFVYCTSENEIDQLWRTLSNGGKILMSLDRYPWAPKYGWTADKFGVTWQLMLVDKVENDEKIVPALLFVNDLFGKGAEAIALYQSVFPDSKVLMTAMDEKTNTILHCAFTLNGQRLVLMEGQGSHQFTFTHAFSLMANCETQDEIDRVWSGLTAGGSEEPCGWLRDKFGVSWQVVTPEMEKWVSDPRTSEPVMGAVLQMKKPDLAKLRAAAAGAAK